MKNAIVVSGNNYRGKVQAIPSKSYAHRIAICNFLSGKKSLLDDVVANTSNDIRATVQCLKDIQSGKTVLDCGESGSTLRFIIPLVMALGGEYTFMGHGKLMDRPNQELFDALSVCGARVESKGGTIHASGKLTAAEYKIRGDISSQYISGLLMALPILDGDSRITLTTPLVSSPYVDITLEVVSAYGIKIEKDDNGFVIRGNAKYDGDLTPEGDWSNAAFFLALGAIGDSVTVSGLNNNSVQGDRVILEVLSNAGARITIDGDSVTVSRASLEGFTMDAEHCPDLVPIASVVAALSTGVSVINNISRLKIKESDRVHTTIAMLSAFGITAREEGNSLIITGGTPHAGKVQSYNDHRIAMAAAIMATAVDGDSVIEEYRATDKSYPTFFTDLAKIGGTNEV